MFEGRCAQLGKMSSKSPLSISDQIEAQALAVENLISFFSDQKDYSRIIYTEWTAKDVLAHLVSWHMSFAKNLVDVIRKNKPNPFKGSLAEVNEAEVRRLSGFSIDGLINMIKDAQETIMNNIENEEVDAIPYKKGSRDYKPQEHLEIVEKHILGHIKDLKKSYKM